MCGRDPPPPSGPLPEKMLKEITADKVFLGFDAIDLEKGPINSQIDAIVCKQMAIANSKLHIGLCDHSKFTSSAVVQVCPMSDLDMIITDTGLSDEIFAGYQQKGIHIIRA